MAMDILYNIATIPTNFLRSTLCIILLTLLFKYLADKFRRNPRFVELAATLPGPFDLPLIGNGLEFFYYTVDDFNEIFKGYTKKYGSVYRMWIGKQLVVGLSDPEHLEFVFQSPKVLAKPDLFQGFHQFWKTSVFTAPMHIWRITRKRLQPMFAKNVVKFQIPLINEAVNKYVELMKKEVDGPEFDLRNYMPLLTVHSFIRIHFGMDLTKEQLQYFGFHDILSLVGKNGVFKILIPWMRINIIHRLYFKKSLTAATAILKEFFDMVKNIKFPEREKEEDEKKTKAEILAKSLLSTTRQLDDALKIDDHSFRELSLLVCAAGDTTSVTISFFLLSVAMYPKIQEKLYNELCEIFDPEDNRPVTADDLHRLTYLDQVLKETQRIFTLVPVIFRAVEEDIEIGSMIIPSGTTIMARIGDVHMNPDLYPNPYEFNPENFSPEAISRRSKYSLVPFGAGTRECIARSYAEIAMKVMLAVFLRNFRFSTTTEMKDIKYALSFTVGKKDGYWVRITSRKN